MSPTGSPRLGPAVPVPCAPVPCSLRRRRRSRRPASSRSTRYDCWSWTCIVGNRRPTRRGVTACADCGRRCCPTPRSSTSSRSRRRGPTPRPRSATSWPRPRRPAPVASTSTAGWWPSRSAVAPIDGATSSDSPSHPDARRQGLAAQLLTDALRWMRRRGRPAGAGQHRHRQCGRPGAVPSQRLPGTDRRSPDPRTPAGTVGVIDLVRSTVAGSMTVGAATRTPPGRASCRRSRCSLPC